MSIGVRASAIGHGSLLLYLALAGAFSSGDPPAPPQATGVSLISSGDFEALGRAEPAPDTRVAALPPAPSTPPERRPEPPAPAPEPAVATPEPSPPPTPPADSPRPAPELAPAEPAPAPRQPEPPAPADAAPKPAAPPKPRPQRAESDAEAAADQEPPTSELPEEEEEDGLADAIAAAVAEATAEEASSLAGASLDAGARDGLRLAVSRCWNLHSTWSDALDVVVVVGFRLDRDGRPMEGSIKLLDSSGGSDAAAERAYGAARRAIIRCGANGYDLPPEKYDLWRNVEITFNPEEMR